MYSSYIGYLLASGTSAHKVLQMSDFTREHSEDLKELSEPFRILNMVKKDADKYNR